MTTEERQFLRTAVWLFMRHGRSDRALGVCEALHEADPRDGVAAVALAELLLERADAKRAVEVLREADVPPELAHAEAVLETRALRLAGRARQISGGGATSSRGRAPTGSGCDHVGCRMPNVESRTVDARRNQHVDG